MTWKIWAALLAGVVGLLGGGIFWFAGHAAGESFARDLVLKSLEAPATAKFTEVRRLDNDVSGTKQYYLFHAVVDAQNTYGALTRRSYCVAFADAGSRYEWTRAAVQQCTNPPSAREIATVEGVNDWPRRRPTSAPLGSGGIPALQTFREMSNMALAAQRRGESAAAAGRLFVGETVALNVTAGDTLSGVCRGCVELIDGDIRLLARPAPEMDILQFLLLVERNAGKHLHVEGTVGGTQDSPSRSPLWVKVTSIGSVEHVASPEDMAARTPALVTPTIAVGPDGVAIAMKAISCGTPEWSPYRDAVNAYCEQTPRRPGCGTVTRGFNKCAYRSKAGIPDINIDAAGKVPTYFFSDGDKNWNINFGLNGGHVSVAQLWATAVPDEGD